MLRTGKRLVVRTSLFLFLLVAAPSLYAQGNGHIKGMVADSAGVGIAESVVIFESGETKREATTDAKGLFEIKLPAGIYQVTAEKLSGFAPVKLSRVRIKADRMTMLTVKVATAPDDACVVETPKASKEKTAKKPKP